MKKKSKRKLVRPKDPHNGHVWKSDGLGGGHRGEYYYTCQRCGLEDWIASYGTLEQISGTPCLKVVK